MGATFFLREDPMSDIQYFTKEGLEKIKHELPTLQKEGLAYLSQIHHLLNEQYGGNDWQYLPRALQ